MTAEERFADLYGSHASAVLAYALRRTSSANAEDVMAEVFLVTWRRLGEVPSDARIWLLGVARKVLANQRRGLRRQEATRERLAGEAQRRAGLGGAQTGVGDAGEERVREALAQLRERDREVLLLLAWEGLSNTEAAAVLGIGARTFNVRLHRARRRFTLALAALESEAEMTSNPDPVEVL